MTETKGKKLFSGIKGGVSKFMDKVEKKISEASGVDMSKVIAEEKQEKEALEQKEQATKVDQKKDSNLDLKKTFGKVTGGVSKFMDKVEKKISEVSGMDLDSLAKMPEKKEKEEDLEDKK